jgi:hypothetical protein
MQHLQSEGNCPEFPPHPQSFHPHSHNFWQQKMVTGHSVDLRPTQPSDQLINVSAVGNPNSIPVTMDPRFLANLAGTLSQLHPPHLGSAPSPLTGILHLPYFPMVGFAQGNNYIGVLNIESPTRPKQSKKQKCGGTSPSQRCKGKNNISISHKELY